GTEVARILADKLALIAAPGGKVQVEQDLPSLVAFDEPEVFATYTAVLPTLREISRIAMDTIDRLQSAFGIPNFRFPHTRT
ncbi:MAG TPA: hypothetical protein VHW01_01835, partial [Polyangiaceae bacterium]|nr:hypothetical protein [Polyangiaceae bacterium]